MRRVEAVTVPRYYVQEFPDKNPAYSVMREHDGVVTEEDMFYDRADAEADAKDRNLAAAAPALYEALEEAVRFVYHIPHCNGGTNAQYAGACPKCKFYAALKLARGES